ncbi:MAG: zinc ribbon domain-containing protein [Asgard group archaeon]|nr:zinc ribbon domain-containing protein [Asgard group archaeon]
MTISNPVKNKSKSKRVIFITKASAWAFFTYAPLLSMIINLIVLPGHVILLPYYLLVMIFRGSAPNFLIKWIHFNSHGLYRVKTIEGKTCQRFWCLYLIYGGYIISFVFWTIIISFAGLIFPILLYIEEWKTITNLIYRLTFGYWGKIINESPETIKDPSIKTTVVTEDVVDEKPKDKKKKHTSCPVCGVEIETETTYCPKCGSLIEG